MLRRTFKFLLYFPLVLIIIFYIAIYTATYFIDINDYKSDIQNKLNELDKGTFVLNGRLSWVRFPSIGIEVQDMNYDSNKTLPLDANFSSKNIILGVNPLVLLFGEVNISKMYFDNLKLNVILPDEKEEQKNQPEIKSESQLKITYPLHKNPIGPWVRLSISDYAVRDLDLKITIKGKTHEINNLNLEGDSLRITDVITLNKFSVRLKEIKAGDLVINDISTDLKVTKDRLRLDHFRFFVFGSKFEVGVESELSHENFSWKINSIIENLDLNKVKKDLKIDLPASGIINTKLDLHSRGLEIGKVIDNLELNGEFYSDNLTVGKNINLGKTAVYYSFKNNTLSLDKLDIPKLNSKFDIKFNLKNIDLNNLDLLTWHGNYNMSIDFDSISKVINKPDLARGKINILGDFSGRGVSEDDVLNSLESSSNITSDELYLVQENIKSIDTDIRFKNRQGFVDINFKPLGGNLRFISNVNLADKADPKIKTIFRINNIDINPYMQVLSDLSDTRGFLNVDIALRTSGAKTKDMIKNLDGFIKVNIKDFWMKDVKLSLLLTGASGGSFGRASADLTNLFASNIFRHFSFNAVIEKGVFKDDFQMLGDNFDLVAKGDIDLVNERFVDKYKVFLKQKKRGLITEGPTEEPIPLLECGGKFSNILCIPSPDSDLFPCGKKPKQDGGSGKTRSMVF